MKTLKTALLFVSFLSLPAVLWAAEGPVVILPEAVETPHHTIRRIIIDAGHGGKDFGAISKNGLREKEVVLDVAKKVRDRLQGTGIEVLMTRADDTFIPLADRAIIANSKSADFFVSIHANASTSPDLSGFEIYYLSEATDDAALAVERAENSVLKFETAEAANLGDNLKTIYWDLKESENRRESLKLADSISGEVGKHVQVAAQRIRTANFYVLKWTECPAALVEIGYLTNRADERQLKSPIYRERLAEGIVRGLLDYKNEFERTDGFTT